MDEDDWTTIPDDDVVWSGPTRLPPPLADPAPSLLNTHEMDWESFECLVLAMARSLDGGYDVRRYGRLGQAQHGLDVVAFFAERKPSVYQAKRWQAFGAGDLEEAVDRYTEGRRPFGADRIVIAVATEARDTQTIEKLAELREKHKGMKIELWDRRAISDRLRNQTNIVSTFFGPATAAAFCTTTPPQPPIGPAPQASIAADAILRGPVAHLGLTDDLRRAEEAVGERPDEAAELLAQIADRLEGSGFVPHASRVRELQAMALRAAGRRAEEAWVRIDLGWRQFDAGDTLSAAIQIREIGEWGDEAPEDVVRCANALSHAIRLRRDYAGTLDHLAEAVDALTDGDPHRVDAVLVLAEEAVAARRPEFVEARSDLLARSGRVHAAHRPRPPDRSATAHVQGRVHRWVGGVGCHRARRPTRQRSPPWCWLGMRATWRWFRSHSPRWRAGATLLSGRAWRGSTTTQRTGSTRYAR